MTPKLLTIDQLRLLGTPEYFGLGFIQLKIDKTYRYHFYHDSLEPIVPDDEIHDHRYNFKSHILQGEFTQLLYEFEVDHAGTHEIQNVDCKGPSDHVFEKTWGNLKLINRSTYSAGSSYWINRDVLHTVIAHNNAITLLERDTVVKQYARVARPRGVESVCPFSAPLGADRCWELIEDMLPRQA
jgi:hypothetical protein